MRQFAGFGSPAQTNARYRYLLEHGQTGLSVAFDLPTLMGRDSDDGFSRGEVGRCGVAVDSAADMDTLFDGIPLGGVTTSMTINGPAPILFAFYLAAAERQGVAWRDLGGTLQTDIFKEYIAQKEWLFPPRPHLRLIGDLMAFCAAEVPRFHPISVSGYHIREAGSTAVQELAFTLADGLAYVELGMRRGLDVDAFAPRLSFFFNAHIDLFEEVAKYRAARRIWARWLRDRYGATRRALVAAAVPRADGGLLAHGRAARQQRRPDHGRGARGRARRGAVAAHELARRGPRAADRPRRADRPADPAGDRVRDRRPRRDRPARRLVPGRVAHRPGRGRGRGADRRARGDGRRLGARRGARGGRDRVPAGADRRRRVRGAAAVRRRRAGPGRRDAVRRRRRRCPSTCSRSRSRPRPRRWRLW